MSAQKWKQVWPLVGSFRPLSTVTLENRRGKANWIPMPHCGDCGKAIEKNSATGVVVCHGRNKDGTECGFVNEL
jgi:hypothetical protein